MRRRVRLRALPAGSENRSKHILDPTSGPACLDALHAEDQVLPDGEGRKDIPVFRNIADAEAGDLDAAFLADDLGAA